MRSFAEILEIAAERKGGVAAVLAAVPPVKSADDLAAIPDSRWLAQMARGIFQAGISWAVVEAKWPGIEEAFHGFDPARVAMIEGEALEALLSDTRVIRSGAKIVAIRDNAVFIRQVAQTHGSFGRRIGDWPARILPGCWSGWSRTAAGWGARPGPTCCGRWARKASSCRRTCRHGCRPKA